ncbi:MAG: hypothetical protein MUE44_35335 [Oscillatoriaceae cyanobacterium Prado104]|nr:hypothetical protein [Oscillatoriaceae cyanobacterium Prado104]
MRNYKKEEGRRKKESCQLSTLNSQLLIDLLIDRERGRSHYQLLFLR